MTEDASNRNVVYVSYASPDVAIARAILVALERNHLRCWMAPGDVTPGSAKGNETAAAINDARLFVLILSEHAVASSHVGKEIERACAKRLRIIALRTDASALTRSFEYFLRQSQWIDVAAMGMPGALTELVQAVGQGLEPSLWVSPGLGSDARNTPDRKRGPSYSSIQRMFAVAMFLVAAGIVVGVLNRYWPSKLEGTQAPAVTTPSGQSSR